MDDEPIYWSGEPEPTRIAPPPRAPRSNVIVVHYQRILARMAWLIMIAVLGGIVVMNWLPPYQQSNVRMLIRGARNAVEHTAMHPRIALPLVMAGVFDAMGVYDRAIASYDTILAIDPDFGWGYYGRGAAHHAMGHAEAALVDLSTAIQLDPELVWAYNMRGLVSRDAIRDYDMARVNFIEAVRIDPDFAWAHVNLARLEPDAERALDHFDQAIALGLDDRPEVYVHRANAYTRLRRYDEALDDFRYALELEPEFAWVYYYRPRVWEALEEPDAAIDDYERFLNLYPVLDENSMFARSELERLGAPVEEHEPNVDALQ